MFWNINGIKQKFQSAEVQELFKLYDIVIISETHLNIRDKCPNDFVFIGRSKPIESLTPRGGVAVFRNVYTETNAEVISTDFKDCVIFNIEPHDMTCVALYIPPSNSKYFSDE